MNAPDLQARFTRDVTSREHLTAAGLVGVGTLAGGVGSDRFAQAVLDCFPDATVVVDRGGTVLCANQPWLAHFENAGGDPAATVGQRYGRVIPPALAPIEADRQRVMRMLQALAAAGEAQAGRVDYRVAGTDAGEGRIVLRATVLGVSRWLLLVHEVLAPSHRPLSARERAVLVALAEGRTVAQVARGCFISETTAKTHLRNASRKLQARNRAHAVALGLELGEIAIASASSLPAEVSSETDQVSPAIPVEAGEGRAKGRLSVVISSAAT
jgi:DNA-binding CsgD family transcriptional regulator